MGEEFGYIIRQFRVFINCFVALYCTMDEIIVNNTFFITNIYSSFYNFESQVQQVKIHIF